MTIWGQNLVVLRTHSLEFYTLPSPADHSIIFLKLLKTPTIWEAAVCPSTSISPDHVSPLRLITITSDGIELCIIKHGVLTGLDDAICSSLCLAQSPRDQEEDPWYRLCIGETGRRSLWISLNEQQFCVAPHLVYMNVPLLSVESGTDIPRICWSDDKPDHTALWALPVVDFDDALGFTVIGNCFGELSIYDHVGNPTGCGDFLVDFTDQSAPLPPLLSNVSDTSSYRLSLLIKLYRCPCLSVCPLCPGLWVHIRNSTIP